jgi:hypothetical protein
MRIFRAGRRAGSGGPRVSGAAVRRRGLLGIALAEYLSLAQVPDLDARARRFAPSMTLSRRKMSC